MLGAARQIGASPIIDRSVQTILKRSIPLAIGVVPPVTDDILCNRIVNESPPTTAILEAGPIYFCC